MMMTTDNHIRIDGDDLAAELGYSNLHEMRQELKRMCQMAPVELIAEQLSDLNNIEIDDSLTVEERALSLLRQTHNPYFYRYEDMIVMISEEEKQALESFFENCLYIDRGEK